MSSPLLTPAHFFPLGDIQFCASGVPCGERLGVEIEGLSHHSSDKESIVKTQLDQNTVDLESRGNVLNCANKI